MQTSTILKSDGKILDPLVSQFNKESGRGFCVRESRILREVRVADFAWVLWVKAPGGRLLC